MQWKEWSAHLLAKFIGHGVKSVQALICIIISDMGDYLGINQTVTFEVEEVEKEVQVQIVDNAAVEHVEQFSVFLTPLPGVFPVAVLNSTAVVSIADNDGM